MFVIRGDCMKNSASENTPLILVNWIYLEIRKDIVWKIALQRIAKIGF